MGFCILGCLNIIVDQCAALNESFILYLEWIYYGHIGSVAW